ncbi:unnamed protein product [Parnassius apollo]|uniref:(apollo) hypothetical protein n=1 Tax=Parnassius apollo TaxID=110799 RepID=A0A8S3W0G1_PARAO|nr:unnamed protein product [Parnassius apollo]
MDEESLLRLCSSAFTCAEIQKSKALFFDAIPSDKRKIQRKGEGKEKPDLQDIIQLFKTTEPDLIPIFVARELEKLPPITSDHLDCTKVLKDIAKLRFDIDCIKSTYTPLEQHKELESKVLVMKDIHPPRMCNMNPRLSLAWGLDSGPIGMSAIHNSTFVRSKEMKNTIISSSLIRDETSPSCSLRKKVDNNLSTSQRNNIVHERVSLPLLSHQNTNHCSRVVVQSESCETGQNASMTSKNVISNKTNLLINAGESQCACVRRNFKK